MSSTPLPATASSQELLLTNSTTLSGYLGSSSSSSSPFLSSPASSMETQPSPRRPFYFYFGRRRVCFAKKNKPNFIPIKKQHPLEEIAQESVGSTQSSPPYGFFGSREKLVNSTDTFSTASSATTRKRKDGGFHNSVHVAKNKLLKFDTPTETFLETKDAGQELDLTELLLCYEYEYEGSQESLTPTNSTTDSIYWGSSSAFSYFLSSLASSMEAQPSRPFYFGRRRGCAKKSKPDFIVIKKRDPHEESAEESAGSTES